MTARPGETPTLPVTALGPVLVTVVPASTPKPCTVGPSVTWARTRPGASSKAATAKEARRERGLRFDATLVKQTVVMKPSGVRLEIQSLAHSRAWPS